MECNKTCDLGSCFASQFRKSLSSLFDYGEISSDFSKTEEELRICMMTSKWLRFITRNLANSFMELRFCKIKFSPEVFHIIRVKHNVWLFWFMNLQNFFIMKNYRDCDRFAETILESMQDVELKYTEEILSLKSNIGDYFIRSHKKVYEVLVDKIKSIIEDENLELSNKIDKIGEYLSGALAYAISEVTTIDAILQGHNVVFVLPEIFFLNGELNLFKTIIMEFPRASYRIYFINPTPEAKMFVRFYLEKDNLFQYFKEVA